jgi:hypothetical protein
MSGSAVAPIDETEVRRYLRVYISRRHSSDDPAVIDDIVDVTIAVMKTRFEGTALSCKPTTLAVSIFRRQLSAYRRRLDAPPGGAPRGRRKAERYEGDELEKRVRQDCRQALTSAGLNWGTVRKVLYPHLTGGGAVRTKLVRAVDIDLIFGEAKVEDRLLARMSLLAGCFPRIPNRSKRSVGEVISREIEALRIARLRLGKRKSQPTLGRCPSTRSKEARGF